LALRSDDRTFPKRLILNEEWLPRSRSSRATKDENDESSDYREIDSAGPLKFMACPNGKAPRCDQQKQRQREAFRKPEKQGKRNCKSEANLGCV
jgi:hypothetical protein